MILVLPLALAVVMFLLIISVIKSFHWFTGWCTVMTNRARFLRSFNGTEKFEKDYCKRYKGKWVTTKQDRG